MTIAARWTRYSLILLAALLVIMPTAGCVSVDVTRYRTLPPKPSPDAVKIFTSSVPERSYVEVGLIEIEGDDYSSYGELIRRAQVEGAKIGADAILVSRRPVREVGAIVVDGPLPGVFAGVDELPRIWVVAVAWEQ